MEREFSTRKLIILGSAILLVTVGGFLFWSMTMSLSSASVAHGNLVVESKRKQIQHLQGGWVKEVLVKDGQQVEVGQVLLELSDTKSESDYKRYLYRNFSLVAQKARLEALLNESEEPKWPEVLVNEQQDSLIVMPIVNSERVQFEQGLLRKQLIDSLYNQKSTLYKEKIQGNQFQKKAVASQRDLIKQEIDMTKGLVAKGYVSKTRMLELRRHLARIEGELAEINVTIDVTKRELETLEQSYKSQLLDLKRDYAQQLKSVNDEVRDVKQVMNTLEDVRSRIQIRSEFKGRVVGLNISSVGGVVRPGQVLMEIVPDSDELIVEAIVPPRDIDIVRSGQDARIRLTAYSARQVPPVLGEVIHVSADRVVKGGDADEKDQGYLVKIRFDRDDLQSLQAENHIELYPGMLTEVLILVEERTLWDYLIGPLTSGMAKAMREA
ncbi:HlyD family type I secretion periplasmic adaptor subunit [Vibrio sp. THAF190c]|uniref:HlyD family type I secretion periplasmic adaptor subunit n=1 Tax=Vibrio TaxID=662 RepID=UPI0012690A13|nr:HlyD family type I secretion periplasmic adaptor subunit [Vibrio sp. THAF190c]QFT12585.1 Type I secretion system membrane fusion protein PrsE [Vibrio sp. THAF190c]|tara:strand:- start:1216 stop:2529 length:1314 start_codon:yes stop_codon:yes gene_type:complete